MTELIVLRPYPFCGESPELKRTSDRDGAEARVKCPSCYATGPFVGSYEPEYEQKAIEVWNRRAS